MIRIENLHIRQGEFELRDFNMTIPVGTYGVLMGRSGCGKTSIMEAVCGLRTVNGGRIILHDDDVTHLPPGARGIGYVPQDAALFPGLLVREQLAFALVLRKRPEKEISHRVSELAEMLNVTHLLNRMPDRLSGGERQRVAFGRALATKPPILCLDEPLSALDSHIHADILALIKQLVSVHQVTTLHITHSRIEADALADHIFTI
jgi:ABC-type sugar transport system ATPase subunit